jgi:hypothetical protein
MAKLLPYLEDSDLVKSYRDFCLKRISAFNGKDKSEVLQVSHVVESCLEIVSTDDFKRDLENLIRVNVEFVLTAADTENLASSVLQLEQLISRTEHFCISTLTSITNNFGNFGLMTWCPLLAKVCLEVGLARFELIRSQFKELGDSAKQSKLIEFHTNTFVLFNQVQK